MSNKVILTILDGWGLGAVPDADAIKSANTPFMDYLQMMFPHATLVTHGEYVGLPDGQMGNSEVGHLNIGAGKIVYQELVRINKAIRDKELNSNPVLLKNLKYAKDNDKALHFIGLVSDGGVHSHINHLKGLCDIALENGLTKIYIHAFTDGRDTDPKSGIHFLQELDDYIKDTPIKVVSVIGRYYAMDRDKRWERIKLAYDLLVRGIGEKFLTAEEALQASYDKDISDEFILPCVIGDAPVVIQENDVVLNFNFRTDRPREITEVLCQMDLVEYDMKKLNIHYVTMAKYNESYENVDVLFTKDNLKNTLGEILANAGKTQLRIAETEKYPHVTFFFSGGREEKFENENRIMIPSPKVATYDLQPEMSALEITAACIREIEHYQPDFICLNFANTDMVGHTGDFNAAIKAAETVDSCLQNLINKAINYNYTAIVIADHGNSDYMINEDGTPNTAHTMNPVPIILVGKDVDKYQLNSGKLADVAPTILYLMGIEKPKEMTGDVLVYS